MYQVTEFDRINLTHTGIENGQFDSYDDAVQKAIELAKEWREDGEKITRLKYSNGITVFIAEESDFGAAIQIVEPR